MHASQLLNVLVLALSTANAAQALKIDPKFAANHGGFGQIAARQDTGDDDASPTGQDSKTTPSSSNTLSRTSAPPTTSKPDSSSSTPPEQTTPPTSKSTTSEPGESTPGDTSPTPEPTPSPTPKQTSNTTPKETTTTTSPPPSNTGSTTSYSTSTIIITTTDAAGRPSTHTTISVSTSTPGLANTQSNDSKGMTPQTRNTVIGVVVGVGGAIVLAGIAFLALRLYRKKQPEEADGLMEYNSGFVAADKSEVASSTTAPSTRTPFQSTLESYHAPQQVNTASNF
ncbi:hypothetical protein GE09DRAFT_199836 [Coniochaeta sp. 2T2.1]|nr:hypothetical protein GE09DRAFT_199836 [Coniochaeta sp. 2T2.1]